MNATSDPHEYDHTTEGRVAAERRYPPLGPPPAPPDYPAPFPDEFGSWWQWFGTGLQRYLGPAIIALTACWSAFWLVLWIAVLAALLFAAGAALISLGVAGTLSLPIPAALQADLAGMFAPIAAVVGGLAGLALVMGTWVAIIVTHLPAFVFSLILGAICCAVIVFIAFAAEPWTLHLRGYSRLSKRERRRLASSDDLGTFEAVGEYDRRARGLLIHTAQAMRLSTVPRLLVDESRHETAAYCHMRHIVLNHSIGLHAGNKVLEDHQVCAILAHELHHYRRGDAFGLRFLWACTLPIAVLYNLGAYLFGLGGRVRSGAPSHPISAFLFFVGWVILWPAWAILRLLIAPLVAARMRRHEYEADQAAVDAGFGQGLLEVLERSRDFEPARTGWESVLNASHPRTELRIEAVLDRMADIANGVPPPPPAPPSRRRLTFFRSLLSWESPLANALEVLACLAAGVILAAAAVHFTAASHSTPATTLPLVGTWKATALNGGSVPAAQQEVLSIRADGMVTSQTSARTVYGQMTVVDSSHVRFAFAQWSVTLAYQVMGNTVQFTRPGYAETYTRQ